MKKLKRAALLLPLLALSACTHHLSSAELHAKHYIYQTRDDFDPQFRTDVNGSIKNAVPMFEQFYQLGKRIARQAWRAARRRKRPTIWPARNSSRTWNTKPFSSTALTAAPTTPNAAVFSQEAVGAYWDGYEGR